MKTTRVLTIALLFASTAEAQSLFNNYQLMNLAEQQNEAEPFMPETIELDSLDMAEIDERELENLNESAIPNVQSLASKATSTVMDGMKNFTDQLEELIKGKVADFTTTMLESEKKKVETKHKKKHHKKAKRQAESESESEEEHEEKKKKKESKKVKKAHHKKSKKVEETETDVEVKPAVADKKTQPSLEDLAAMIKQLQNMKSDGASTIETDAKAVPEADASQLEEDFNLFPFGHKKKRVFIRKVKKQDPPKPEAPKAKMSPEEILNKQAQMTQKKINDARLKVLNLKTALEDAVREVKELSEMQAMTEGEMLGLHERMLAKEQALDMKLQLDYQNNLHELEKMRHQWGGNPSLPVQSVMPTVAHETNMLENMMDSKRTDAILKWYAGGRGRGETSAKVVEMANKLKRAQKMQARGAAVQSLTGGSPDLESLRNLLSQQVTGQMSQMPTPASQF